MNPHTLTARLHWFRCAVRSAFVGAILLAGALVAAPASEAKKAELAALKAKHKALDDELRTELQRLQKYLNYVDQTFGARIVQGQLTAEQAATELQRMAVELYRKSFTQPELTKRISEHRSATDALFNLVEQRIATATRWPADRPGQDYRALAKKELEGIRQQFRAQYATPLDLNSLLSRAVKTLAWTRGETAVPEERDPFAGSQERVITALSEERAGHVVSCIILRDDRAGPPMPPSPPRGSTEVPFELRPPVDGSLDAAIKAAVSTAQQGRFAEGRQLFEAVLRDAPTSLAGLSGLAFCQDGLGEIDAALRTYETLYRIAPATRELPVWFAQLLIVKGDYAAARRWVERELQAYPNSVTALSLLGSVEWGEGREEPARQAFARALGADPKAAQYRSDNALRYWTTQPARALVDFTAVLFLDPNASGTHYYMGDCYARTGDKRAAAESYRRYLQSDPTSEWAGKARQQLAELESRGAR